jgi:hypothetical protein
VRGFSRSQNQFHVVEPFLAVRHTYHALAIDEHRPAYRHELMRIPAEAAAIGATLNQTWFVGAHSNVGGGYRGDLLSMVPLAWMQARAADHGLVFREEVDLRGDEHLGPLRDSFAEFLSGAYRVARAGRRHWRAIGEPDQAALHQAGRSLESLHHTVCDRWRKQDAYRPQNLRAWAERRGINLAVCDADVPVTP